MADRLGTVHAVDIAAELSISPETIRKHWQAIIEALGVHDRHAATLVAARKGLVEGGWPPCPPGRKCRNCGIDRRSGRR